MDDGDAERQPGHLQSSRRGQRIQRLFRAVDAQRRAYRRRCDDRRARRSGRRDNAPPIARRRRRWPAPAAARRAPRADAVGSHIPQARHAAVLAIDRTLAHLQISPATVGRAGHAHPALPTWVSTWSSPRATVNVVEMSSITPLPARTLKRRCASGLIQPGTPTQQLDLACMCIEAHGNRTVRMQHCAAAIGQLHVLHDVRAAMVGLAATRPPAMPPASPARLQRPLPSAFGRGVRRAGPAGVARHCATALVFEGAAVPGCASQRSTRACPSPMSPEASHAIQPRPWPGHRHWRRERVRRASAGGQAHSSAGGGTRPIHGPVIKTFQ